MQKHIRIFRKFYGIGDQDPPLICAVCPRQMNDAHHIHSRGLKGFEWKGKWYDINDILNLIPLCRDHHNGAHGGEFTKEYLLEINEIRILKWSK